MRGLYWATCFRVLFDFTSPLVPSRKLEYAVARETVLDSLLSNTFQGGVVVESEIASVDDIVGLCFLREIVQGSEVTYQPSYS